MKTPYLTMEIEELCKAISFMDGKKSYFALNYVRDAFTSYKRGQDHDTTELKIRGISWSKMSDELRAVVTQTLRAYLESS